MASVYSTNLSLVPGIGPKTEVTAEAFLAIIQTCLKADSCHFNAKIKKTNNNENAIVKYYLSLLSKAEVNILQPEVKFEVTTLISEVT